MSNSIPSTPRRQSKSETDTETSSLVSSASNSEQSNASEDSSEKSAQVPVMKTRQTRDTAQATHSTNSTNSSAPLQAVMTASSPTVTNRLTEDQKRARYSQTRNLPSYQRDTNIKKVKQGGAADIQQTPKPDRMWEKFSKAVRAKGKLELDNLDRTDINKLVAWLKTSPADLRTLKICGCDIGDAGAARLADAIQFNTTLATLDLFSNKIGSDGAAALAEALKINKTLSALLLRWNSISDEGAGALADALEVNTALTVFCLQRNHIGHTGAAAIAGALRGNTTLTTLSMTSNQIGYAGTLAMADLLRGNTTLTNLDFSVDQIGDEGIESLADALKTNKKLIKLNLANNNIGNAGAVALADALRNNSTLNNLNVKYNRIRSVGALALVEALNHNQTLTTLTTQFSDDGYTDIDIKINERLEINKQCRLMSYAAASLELLVRHSPELQQIDVPQDVLNQLAEHLTDDVLENFRNEWRDAFRTPSRPVTTTTTNATVTTTTTTATDSTIPTMRVTLPTAPATDPTPVTLSMPEPTATAAEITALLADPNPVNALSRWIDGQANPQAALNWVDPSKGYTLLHYAVIAQQGAVIRSLVSRGIDLQKTDHNNQTAAQLAQARADSSSSQVAASIAKLLR